MMQLQNFLETLWIKNISRIQKFTAWQHNDSYKVESGGKTYSVRVYNYKKPSQIRFELEILKKLKNTGLTPCVLTFWWKSLHKFWKKYLIVYEYLPWESIKSFTPQQLQEVGKFIWEYHRACKNFSWGKYRYQFYHLPDSKIQQFTEVSKKAKLKYLEFLPKIIQELKENRLPKSLPRWPIHVDIKPENVLFYHWKLSWVLDFDNAFMWPFLLDIAKSMVWFGTRDKQFSLDDAKNIFRGYTQVRTLSNEEQTYLYRAIKFAFLSHIFVDYYMRAVEKTTQEYFESIIHDLYASYKTFTVSEKDFYTQFTL